MRVAVLVVVWSWLSAVAASPAQAVDYQKEIKPVLKARCYACHGALKQESSLRLDTGVLIRKGGDGGSAVIPGKPNSSPLLERITAKDASLRMPPDGEPLTAAEIEKFRQWIAAGANSPAEEQPEKDPRDHWAFRVPVRPTLPTVKNPKWVLNPIDAFIAAGHDKQGLKPQPDAEKSLLLRRVYLDLTGLPPTRAELNAFLADRSPDAYLKVVNRLLDSPRYGERWGRHWMDVWRYSDWFGRRYVPDVWNSAPQIWRWRDWIVSSLNKDKGYDQMVKEMLAGDEIAPADDEAGYATGYLIRNWYALNPNDWMRNNVEHTGKAFLGLTLNCAHCHDHKYDPISHDDYFRFRAFFEPIGIRQDRVPGEADPGPFQEYDYGKLRKVVRLGGVRIFDKNPQAPTYFYTGGDERNRVASRGSIPPGVPAFFGKTKAGIETVNLPMVAWYPGMRPGIRQTVLDERRAAIAAAEKGLVAARSEREKLRPQRVADLAKATAAYHQVVAATRKAKESVAAASAGLGAKGPGQAKAVAALAGGQSLLLNAKEGRRILQNRLNSLKSLGEGAAVTFQVRILKDGNINFQFAKDIEAGLTATYVAFTGGKIIGYRPGGFVEFDAGKYDLAAGQGHFEVSLLLEQRQDRALLTIRTLPEKKVLVEKTWVGINGWNPVGKPAVGITFDCRPGTIAMIDDVRILPPGSLRDGERIGGSAPLASYDFEAPKYLLGRDVSNIDEWEINPHSLSPATSTVVARWANGQPDQVDAQVATAAAELQKAQKGVDVLDLAVRAGEARLRALTAELASDEARLSADSAKYQHPEKGLANNSPAASKQTTSPASNPSGTTSAAAKSDPVKAGPSNTTPAAHLAEPAITQLAEKASKLFRDAAVLTADADLLQAEHELAVNELRPDSDKERAKQIAASNTKLATARQALATAKVAAADVKQNGKYPGFGITYPKTSTGRRKALAEWIANRQNPLAARVAVNHIWLRHFHSPLVATVYDFGRNGAAPTHPELIDWLAVEFMESGWSMKHLHRLIVTSRAYQMSSGANGAAELAVDPKNTYLWRMNVGRMEAEVVRDSLLYAGDRLDFQMKGQELENSEALKTNRRTIYYSSQPEIDGKSKLGMLFDAPEPADCYRRTASIIPQQSLALANADFIHSLSFDVANGLWKDIPQSERQTPNSFVIRAFEKLLSRQPTEQELKICGEFLLTPLSGTPAVIAQPAAAAKNPSVDMGGAEAALRRASLVRVLFNHNDFISIR